MGIHSYIKRENKDRGNGLAIVVGSGMLMATMDLLPEVYRFIEYKEIVTVQDIDKVILFGHSSDFIVVNAWFSISSPQSLQYILSHFKSKKCFVYSNLPLIENQCVTLKHLQHEVKDFVFNLKKEMV